MSASVEAIEQAVITLAEVWRGKGGDKLPSPNLIGVGSGRSGTSHLYGLLRPQPDVYVTPVKEANYFGLASRRGMTLREYQTFFAGRREQKWTSEITPVYLYAPGALEEIREKLGPIRIIATLRHPVERMVSHFKFHRSFHGYTDLGAYLRDGLAELERKAHVNWAAPSQGIRMSLYADGLHRARQLFGAENVLVLVYEDLASNPAVWTEQLTGFLDIPIDDTKVPPQFRNPSTREPVQLPDDPVVARIFDLYAADAERLRGIVPDAALEGWSATAKPPTHA